MTRILFIVSSKWLRASLGLTLSPLPYVTLSSFRISSSEGEIIGARRNFNVHNVVDDGSVFSFLLGFQRW